MNTNTHSEGDTDTEDRRALGLAVGAGGGADDAWDDADAEDEEDQRRRERELESMLANAFDDIGYGDDDDDDDIDVGELSTANVSTMDGNESRSNVAVSTTSTAAPSSMEHLQLLYEVQVKEIQRLTHLLRTVQDQNENEKSTLRNKNLLLEAEYDGIRQSLRHSQELLVEKTSSVESYRADADQLRTNLEQAKATIRDAEEEARLWRTRSAELEQKLALLERGLRTPISERQLRDRYEHQLTDLQATLDQTARALEHAQKVKASVENELEQTRHDNELAAMRRHDELHELHSQLDIAMTERRALQDKVARLEADTTIAIATAKEVSKVHDLPSPSSTVKVLQGELRRSLEEQKDRREEVAMLEAKLSASAEVEAELVARVRYFEEKNREALSQKNALEKECEEAKSRVGQLQAVVEELELKISANYEKDAHKFEIKEMEIAQLRKLLEQLQTEMQSKRTEEPDKEEVERSKKELADIEKEVDMWKTQVEKYERLCVELQKTCADQKGQLLEKHARIVELESKLLLKEKRNELLDELQNKAQLFERYIKEKSEFVMVDRATSTEPESETAAVTEMAIASTNYDEMVRRLETENETLKGKVVFDRRALGELTDLWNEEISRLNVLIKTLRAEVATARHDSEAKAAAAGEEAARMAAVIKKLAEVVKAKEAKAKEATERQRHQADEYRTRREQLRVKERQLELRFRTAYEMKEQHLQIKLEAMQANYAEVLAQIQQRIAAHIRKVEEKSELETKIIEAYYAMLISNASSKKP